MGEVPLLHGMNETSSHNAIDCTAIAEDDKEQSPPNKYQELSTGVSRKHNLKDVARTLDLDHSQFGFDDNCAEKHGILDDEQFCTTEDQGLYSLHGGLDKFPANELFPDSDFDEMYEDIANAANDRHFNRMCSSTSLELDVIPEEDSVDKSIEVDRKDSLLSSNLDSGAVSAESADKVFELSNIDVIKKLGSLESSPCDVIGLCSSSAQLSDNAARSTVFDMELAGQDTIVNDEAENKGRVILVHY